MTNPEPKQNSDWQYIITAMPRTELPLLAGFITEIEAAEPTGDSSSLAELEEWYAMPKAQVADFFARQINPDGSAGKVIGHCGGEIGESDREAWAQMWVLPEYRQHGIGRALYQTLMDTVSGWGATALHIIANEKQLLLRDFLARRGFELERNFWQMRLPASQPVAAANFPAGSTVRTFVPGQDEQLLLRVHNDTFAEHYAMINYTDEYVSQMVSQPHFRPEGVFFAFDGEEVVGYCYATINPAEIERRGERVGWIHNVGVMPQYRGQGWGRALLLAGVNYLRQSVPIVELNVEGKNTTALALYESVGFGLANGRMNLLKTLKVPTR